MYKVHNTAMSMYMSMCESESVSGLTNSPLEKSVQLWKDKPARLIIRLLFGFATDSDNK